MDDLTRQAAIDHWRSIIDATDESDRYNMGFVGGLEFCISDLSTMPSAEPEKETCKDCKWEDSLGYGECHHCKRRFEDMWEEKDNG